VRIAIALSERHKILYWDPGIVAAREALGAHTVYSEDLNNGQRFGKYAL
jgi:predicted nucleic acid-binding protein